MRRRILERYGFDISKDECGYFIHQYTPAGEDWGFYVEKLKEVIDYAETFSPDEEFLMWLEAKKSGVSGVPSSDELWKDQLWKQEILEKVSKLRG